MSSDRSLAEKLTNYSTAIWAGLVALAGLAALVAAAAVPWFEKHATLQSILNELGGVLLVSGGLAAIWDLRGKRDLINEVLARVKTSSEVRSSGLIGISMDWKTIPWDDYLKHARDISIFIAYGSSWRKNNWPLLSEFAKKKGHTLKLYLPDPGDETTVAVLAQRFDYAQEKTKAQILEMAEEIAGLYEPGGADIRIYFRAGDPTYTLYQFDEEVVVSLYANRRRRGNVPMLVLSEGSLRDFFREDLTAIAGQSNPVSLDDLKMKVKN